MLWVDIDWDKTTILRKRDPTKAKVTRSDTEINAARRVSEMSDFYVLT
jgi:hypothetical protein